MQPRKVLAFFESAIGQRFCQAKRILREMPFTISQKDDDGDAQIVQGIVDCLFEDQHGNWVLLDYKTDRIMPPFHEEPALTKEMILPMVCSYVFIVKRLSDFSYSINR